MNPSVEGARTWKVQLGWLVLFAVVAAPAVFLFLVTPKASTPQPAALVVKLPPSKLAAVGLRENVDWEGLPEIFAVWADKADWQGERTRVAYWHPIERRYSYFFEVQRVYDGYRFKDIQPDEGDVEGMILDQETGTISDAHPLQLLHRGREMGPFFRILMISFEPHPV